MHRSKGLEFPVVYCPDLWEPSPTPRSGEPVTFHDAAGRRGRSTSASKARSGRGHLQPARRRAARRGPAARLRRADAREAPGGRLVGGLLGQPQLRARPAAVRARRGRERRRRAAPCRPTRPRRERFQELGGGGAGPRQRRGVGARGGRVVAGRRDRDRRSSSASPFDRELDWWWRRTSYSDITAGTYEARVASEPEEPVVDDESAPHAPPVEDDGADALRAVPSLLAEMPVGVEVGTLVHRVFEATDFAAADLDAELAERGRGRAGAAAGRARRRRRGGRGPARGDRDAARAAGRRHARCATSAAPTGSTSSTSSCRWSAATTRRAGADARGDRRRAARAFPPGDPLAGYAERLLRPARCARACAATSPAASTSSLRLAGGDRFAVVDYKTNWLARARRGADGLAPPAGRARRRDARTPTTPCRRCSTPSRCTATCAGGCRATTPSATSPACCTCSCAG